MSSAVEDGEISGASQPQEEEYHPQYEWPGDDNESHQPRHSSTYIPTLRLLVHQSAILPRKQRLAILDNYAEVQFGRDIAPPATDTPRIRLKEMEVSKLHATVFWDADRAEWAAVDMGSKHGTFVKSIAREGMIGPKPSDVSGHESDRKGGRLSMPRMASVPRRLRHLDRLTIGSTTFQVHLHPDRLPCDECSASAEQVGHEIPVFNLKSREGEEALVAGKRKREIEPREDKAADVRKALMLLKRGLLSRPSDSDSQLEAITASRIQYVDRSARRRALHSSSVPDSPGLPSTSPASPTVSPFRQNVITTTSAPPTPYPTHSAPLTVTNVGHQLLSKQGWQPGTALGLPSVDIEDERRRLIEPLEVATLAPRAGLGMMSQGSARLFGKAGTLGHRSDSRRQS